MTCSTSPPSNHSAGSPRTSTSPSAAPSPAPSSARSSPPPTTRSGGPPPQTVKYDGEHLPVWDEHTGTYLDPDTGEVLPNWDQALDAIGDQDEPLHVARFGARFDAQGVLAGSRDASRCIGYLTKYLTKHLGDCHQADHRRPGRPRRTARRRAAVRAVLADLRELAPLRHPAQERPAGPAARGPARAKPTAASTSATPDGASWSPANGPARPWPTTAPTGGPGSPARSGFRQPTRPATPGNRSSPATPDHMPNGQRLLHVVADRIQWQTALDLARRRADPRPILRQRAGRHDDREPESRWVLRCGCCISASWATAKKADEQGDDAGRTAGATPDGRCEYRGAGARA